MIIFPARMNTLYLSPYLPFTAWTSRILILNFLLFCNLHIINVNHVTKYSQMLGIFIVTWPAWTRAFSSPAPPNSQSPGNEVEGNPIHFSKTSKFHINRSKLECPPPLTASNMVYTDTKYIWWLLDYQLVTENAIKGFFEPFIQCWLVDGQPPRIWEINSDWSSYRNGMYRSIEWASLGREIARH